MSGNGGYIFKYSKNSNINNIINEENNINNLNNSINQNIFDFNHDIIPLGPFNPPNLKDIFPLPPMIGLQNVGATCYMNATIQCFGQIEKFTQYFKYYPNLKELIKKYKGRENKDSLSESFKELIENLWPNENSNLINKTYVGKNSNNSYYKPYEFKKKISKMNPLFQGVQANDSKDLVNFIIMQLHEELNMGSKYDNNQDANQTDELAVYNNFRNGYYNENKSIICELFYGINGTLYECSSCRTRKYNFQIGFFYIFPLEEVRKFKIQQNQQMFENNLKIQFANNMLNWNNIQFMQQTFNIQNQNINSVNIIDCFNYNQRQEFMQGENAMFCNTCNRTENAAFQNYICDCPEIMIIILNRGQGIQFKIKLEFTEFLDIGSYVRNNNNNPCNYKLIGVVTHMGESGSSGHFVAFCRSPINEQWYNYNDDLCFPVNNFKKDVIDYAMPYILFYQKV
jgi:ubiquitin C-terminal hydrolase